MSFRPFVTLGLVAITLVGGGCYSMKTITTTPEAGTSIEALLTTAGTAAVTALVGPNASRISGAVRSATAERIEIEISEVLTLDGQSYFLQGSTVSLERSHIATVRSRVFDRRRTLIAATAGVFAAGAIIAGVRFGGGGADGTGGGGGPPALVPPR